MTRNILEETSKTRKEVTHDIIHGLQTLKYIQLTHTQTELFQHIYKTQGVNYLERFNKKTRMLASSIYQAECKGYEKLKGGKKRYTFEEISKFKYLVRVVKETIDR